MKKNFQLSDTHFCVFIVLVGLLLYFKTIYFGYTYTDDTHLIIVNNDILKDLANIPKLFTQDVFISYSNTNLYFRPVLNLSFMMDAQFAGIEPGLYHLTNLVLHMLCSVLVFYFFRSFDYSTMFAGCIALIFTAHPLLTSAVAWIPGRNDSLFALFIIPSFLGFKKYTEVHSLSSLLIHGILFFLALLTKETAVVLPVICLLYGSMIRHERFDVKKNAGVIMTWGVFIVAWFLLRNNVVSQTSVTQDTGSYFDSLVQNIPAFLIYAGKSLFPFSLSVFPNTADYQMWWGLGALIVMGVLYVVSRKSHSVGFAFGMLWFIIFLIPGLITGNIFWEHRAYVPLLGLLFALSVPVRMKFLDNAGLGGAIVALAVVFFFLTLSFFHAEHFRDRKSYVTNAMATSPALDDSYIAMAGNYMDHFDYMNAERVINAGLKKNKNMGSMHKMLGDIYWFRGDTAGAFHAYRQSIAIDPLNLYAYINFGKFSSDVGRKDQTELLWKRTVEINPEFLLGYYYLANFYLHDKNDPVLAMQYADEIAKHGAEVMPELMRDIQNHPLFKKQHP